MFCSSVAGHKNFDDIFWTCWTSNNTQVICNKKILIFDSLVLWNKHSYLKGRTDWWYIKFWWMNIYPLRGYWLGLRILLEFTSIVNYWYCENFEKSISQYQNWHWYCGAIPRNTWFPPLAVGDGAGNDALVC